MKNILALALLLLVGRAFSQVSTEIPLGIFPVKTSGGSLNADQEAAVRSKIAGIVANAGFASTDPNAPVGIVPELVLYEPRKVAAGTRTLTTIDAELVLNVRQRNENGVIFGSKRKRFGVSGRDLQQAQSQLVAQLPVSDPAWQTFLQEMKPKIQDYFNQHCAEILAEADRDANTGNYQRALSALVNMPNGTECRPKADAQLVKTYARARDVICQRNLTQAKSAAAVKDYPQAAAALRNIDPEAACFVEAQAFVRELQQNADTDFRAQLDALTELWKAQSSFDNRRLEIIQGFLSAIF
jgi:hypothetical protein